MQGRGLALCCALVASALATAAPAAARDFAVRSFDGTRISAHFFPAAGLAAGRRAPTVLMGPGWGGKGSTNPDTPTVADVGVVGIGALRRAGYNVLTWDPRGFGASGGVVEIDAAAYEGRDVSALITWLARQSEAQLDRRGDPRVGMAGGSYGGGIQLSAAAVDRRIDAIAPDIAWHSLTTSQDKADTVKIGWSTLLQAAAKSAGQRDDPRIDRAYAEGKAGNHLSPDIRRYFAGRGPGSLVGRIRTPTLLIQGTVDTLFTLQEAVDNYRILAAHHVPVKMLWFCGGHGVCLTNPGDTGRIQRDTLAWFARYLKGRRVSTGPGFEWVDQRGRSFHASRYPPRSGRAVKAKGSGRLRLISTGGSGPYTGPLPKGSSLGPIVRTITAAPATNAVDVRIRFSRPAKILGAPRLTLTYRGTSSRADNRVLAQIVDESTHKVLGNQITPIRVRLDGRRHTLSLPLEILSASASRSTRLTLQLVAQSTLYDTHPVGGSVSFSRIALALPTVR